MKSKIVLRSDKEQLSKKSLDFDDQLKNFKNFFSYEV